MLHTRIRRWKLGRNHKFPEMRTAALLLAQHVDRQRQDNQRVTSPGFVIRGEVVDHSEFLRYFRRKKISDPASWVKEQNDEFLLSEDVELFTGMVTPELNSADSDQHDEEQGNADPNDHSEHQPAVKARHLIDDHSGPRHSSPAVVSRRCDHDHRQPSPIVVTRQSSPVHNSLPTFVRPQTYYCLEHLTYSMSAYMSSYTTSARSQIHTEPTVHAHTVHAMFATRMQDGISLLTTRSAQTRSTSEAAFANFQKGFDLISQILSNDHPMSLSLLFTVICELSRHTALKGLTAHLLQYMAEMSSLVLGPMHALSNLFSILIGELTRPDMVTLANMVLTALGLATDHLSTHSPIDWKSLYLRERLCDALYHSGTPFRFERSSMRTRLLADQERVYGRKARNVLWTLTNVADDALEQDQIDKAIGYYRQALERADASEGYGRAKTRFAALEGMGRCELRMAEMVEEAEIRAQQSAASAERTMNQDMQQVSNMLHSTSETKLCCHCSCHSNKSSTSNGSSMTSSSQDTGQSTPTSSSSQSNQREKHLHQALARFTDAEVEASLWFEETSRRTARVRNKIEQVKDSLGLVDNRDADKDK